MTIVDASPAAIAFIRDHGGRLFVWADAAGLKHVRPRPPHETIDFVQVPCEAFELNVDASIVEAPRWQIVLRQLPFKHVDALWNGTEPYVSQPTNWP